MSLTHACGAKEKETSDGTLGVRKKSARTLERFCNRLNRLVLPYHNSTESILHPKKLLRRSGSHLLHGNRAHYRNRFGHIILGNTKDLLAVALAPLR